MCFSAISLGSARAMHLPEIYQRLSRGRGRSTVVRGCEAIFLKLLSVVPGPQYASVGVIGHNGPAGVDRMRRYVWPREQVVKPVRLTEGGVLAVVIW